MAELKLNTLPTTRSDGANGYYLAAQPRVLRVYAEAHVWRGVTSPTDGPAVAVAIIAADAESLADTLSNLALQTYKNWIPLVVCLSRKRRGSIEAIVKQFRPYLPRIRVAIAQQKITPARAYNVALKMTKAPLFCVVLPYHGLHSQALRVAVAATRKHRAEIYYTARFAVDSKWHVSGVRASTMLNPARLWSGEQEPAGQLIMFNAEPLRRGKGFQNDQDIPVASLWYQVYKMIDRGMRLHYINAGLYMDRHVKAGSLTPPSMNEGAAIRKVMILQHWPDRYVDLHNE